MVVVAVVSHLLGYAALGLARAGAAEETVFFVIRHAEKMSETGDTPLSEAGKKRAKQLCDTLKNLRIDTIFHTDYLRTKQTAEPLATKLHITPNVYTESDQNWIDQLLSSQKGKRVLIVGHSDTAPQIAGRLAGKHVEEIGDEYDNLFIVVIADQQKSMLRLKYGASAD